MKYSTRLSDAVHILAFIALYPDCDLTSNKLAESIQTNPAYVRQLMSALRKGGLLVSVKGHPRPALAREPEKITLLDAYRAVEGNKPLLHQDIHTNPACGVGVNIQLVLRDFYLDSKAFMSTPLRYLLMNAVASRSVSGSFQLPLT